MNKYKLKKKHSKHKFVLLYKLRIVIRIHDYAKKLFKKD